MRSMMRLRHSLLLGGILGLATVGASEAATWVVDNSGSGDFLTIKAALDDSGVVNGDYIQVIGTGTPYGNTTAENYVVTIGSTQYATPILLSKDVDIIGINDPVVTSNYTSNDFGAIADSPGLMWTLRILNVTFEDLEGGGVLFSGTANNIAETNAIISDCVFDDCDVAGEFFNIDVQFIRADTQGGVGIFCYGGTADIDDCDFAQSAVQLWEVDEALIEDCRFDLPSGGSGSGAAVLCYDSELDLEDNWFECPDQGYSFVMIENGGLTTTVTADHNFFIGGSTAIDAFPISPGDLDIVSTNNTYYDNTYGLIDHGVNSLVVRRNIFDANGTGLAVSTSSYAVNCNNFFDNTNDVSGISNPIGSNDNFDSDPDYCNEAALDLEINGSSPCTAGNSPCGSTVGAGLIGCGASGGCPYVYVVTAEGATVENTVLTPVSEEVAGEGNSDVRDRLLVRSEPLQTSDGVRLEIREFEQEHSYFDLIELSLHDHPQGTTVVDTDRGLRLVEAGIAPISAIDGKGQDRLAEVVDNDGIRFEGNAGDKLTLEYRVSGNPDVDIVGLISGIKEEGRPGQVETGISILARSQDATSALSSVHPRELLGESYRVLTEGMVQAIQSNGVLTLELTWNGRHELDCAMLYEAAEGSIVSRSVALTRAIHSSRGDATGDVLAADDYFLELTPGESINLLFEGVPASTSARSYSLDLEGHYYRLPTADTQIGSAAVAFSLEQNTPNPMIGRTAIDFALESAANVQLSVFDVAGRHVRTLAKGHMPSGSHRLHWDGESDSGIAVSPGVYYYRLEVEGRQIVRDMTVLK